MKKLIGLSASVLRLAFPIAVAAVAKFFSDSAAGAGADLFRYKFPCVPVDACYVTQLAHVNNSLDFDPRGSAGLGDIRAVSEGIFVGHVSDSEVCTTSGLGKYVVINDMLGRTPRYGHLSAFGSLQAGDESCKAIW